MVRGPKETKVSRALRTTATLIRELSPPQSFRYLWLPAVVASTTELPGGLDCKKMEKRFEKKNYFPHSL
jgi:hypothetical protein